MVRQPWCACAVVLLLAIAGCGGEDKVSPQIPASIRVVPTAARLIVRDSVQLTATVVDAAGDPIEDQPLTFTSGFPALFSVSPTGLVTSLGFAGQAQIAVTSGQLTAVIDVLAVLPPSAIYVYQAALTLQPGSSSISRSRSPTTKASKSSLPSATAARMSTWSRSRPADTSPR